MLEGCDALALKDEVGAPRLSGWKAPLLLLVTFDTDKVEFWTKEGAAREGAAIAAMMAITLLAVVFMI